jgi:hypothetical protein
MYLFFELSSRTFIAEEMWKKGLQTEHSDTYPGSLIFPANALRHQGPYSQCLKIEEARGTSPDKSYHIASPQSEAGVAGR